MRETLITSSVLIVVIAAIRAIFRGKISARLQYALWGLAALRLLLPFPLLPSPVSVMNAVPQARPEVMEYVVTGTSYLDLAPKVADPQLPEDEQRELQEQYNREWREEMESDMRENGTAVTLEDVLRFIWYAGMGVTGAVFVVSNLVFFIRLRRSRKRLDIEGCRVPVYEAASVASPCLYFGSIYVTPGRAENGRELNHIVTHELTHLRHMDNLWALVRCLCLVIYWFDPLVWLAAALSRRDSELACDESAIKVLGEEERIEYGRTLVGMVAAKSGLSGIMSVATTMTGGKSSIKERVSMIAKKPRVLPAAVAAIVIIAAVAAGCTFTAALKPQEEPSGEATETQPVEPDPGEANAPAPDPVREESPSALAVFEGTEFTLAPSGEKYGIAGYLDAVTDGTGEKASLYCYQRADVDGDGEEELALLVRLGGAVNYGYLIIDGQKEGLIGYEVPYRGFRELRYDGTFGFSGGASNSGYGRMVFTPSGWTIAKTTWSEENDGEVSYFVNGERASRSEFDADMERWYGLARVGQLTLRPGYTVDAATPKAAADAGRGNERLTPEELEYYNGEFFNGGRFANRFLTSYYYSPRDLDLGELFYNGTGEDITQEEVDMIRSMAGEALDVGKAGRSRMDSILREYTGFGLDETELINLGFAYLPEYDAYYNLTGDTNYVFIEVTEGWRSPEGAVSLVYRQTYPDGEPYPGGAEGLVTLRDGRFVSNLVYSVRGEYGFEAQYIRVFGPDEEFPPSGLEVIRSREELDAFTEKWGGSFDLGHRERVYADTSIGFADAVQGFDGEWFGTHELLIALIREGSGSVRHEVTGVNRGLIGIRRIIPEVGTDDMAYWMIVTGVETRDIHNSQLLVFDYRDY